MPNQVHETMLNIQKRSSKLHCIKKTKTFLGKQSPVTSPALEAELCHFQTFPKCPCCMFWGFFFHRSAFHLGSYVSLVEVTMLTIFFFILPFAKLPILLCLLRISSIFLFRLFGGTFCWKTQFHLAVRKPLAEPSYSNSCPHPWRSYFPSSKKHIVAAIFSHGTLQSGLWIKLLLSHSKPSP